MAHQPDPFGKALPGAAPDQTLVRIASPTAKLSKAQRDFNRLSTRITQLRDHLAAWHDTDLATRQLAATQLQPLQSSLAQLQHETVLWIDDFLSQPSQGQRLPRKLRAKLVTMLRLLSQALLDAGPDAEVEAAHDRHSVVSRREALRAQADLAASLLGQATGDAGLFEGDAASVEELLQRANVRRQAQLAADAAAADAAAASSPTAGQQPSDADKAQARQAQALREASQSVRDVYRRLASSLHPDREPDADARAHKTTLMARVNDAYARNDLLALLTVQLDIEQVSAEYLAGVSDVQLRHYCHVFQEQQHMLEDELALLQMPVCTHLQADPGLLRWQPKLLAELLQDDLARVQAAVQQLQEDSQALRNPRTRMVFLRALEVDDPDEAIDPFEELLLTQALQAAMAAAQPTAATRPTKRRRRS